MSIIRIGTTVRTRYGVADVVEIEVVSPGEKYGRAVDEVNTDDGTPFVLDMSNGHWCRDTQVLEVLHHPVRSI